MTVSVPYTPGGRGGLKRRRHLVHRRDGAPELRDQRRYDPKTGTVTFQTNHFSCYAVGYNGVSFADVAETDWYYDAVTYLARARHHLLHG